MAFETRDSRREQTRIARRKITLTSIVTDSEAELNVAINGELLYYMIVAPALTTDTTFDFLILNEDAETIYTNTGVSDDATTSVLLSAAPIPMSGLLNFSVDFTTPQVSEFNIYLYYK